MRSKITIFVLIANVILCYSAWAFEIEADLKVKGTLVDVDGSEAKFNEYMDLTDGLYGAVRLKYESEGGYYLDFQASDIGYDTQKYRLEGGSWGMFNYYLDYNEIPHNFTFGARTFYSGAGTDRLTGPPDTDVGSWSTFDYSLERKTYGGGVELRMLKPFYFTVSAAREDRDGTKPTAAEGGIRFGNTIELPEPIDYQTDTLKVEAGYSKKPLFSSLSLIFSTFDNDNEIVYFDNPFIEGNPRDALTLPPDNTYYKAAFKNTLKLPLNSKLQVNLAYSQTRSDERLLRTFFEGGEPETVSLSDPDFDGKITNENCDFVLTSLPLSFLEGKIFYRYHRLKNDSEKIVTTVGDETLTNEPLNYRNNGYGTELGFRVPANLHLLIAYAHVNKERNREDVTENKDDIYRADLTWTGLDFMSITVGYEKIHRTADFHAPDAAPDEPEYLEGFLKRFDVASKDGKTYKAALDIFPVENLNISLEYRNEDIDYEDTTLGLKESKNDEFSISADYKLADWVKVMCFYDFEKMKHFQVQRRVPFNATSGFDPRDPPTETAFNWKADHDEKTYEYGIDADIQVVPKKLIVRLNHSSVKSNGDIDYTFLLGSNPLPPGRTQDNIDISDWDDYRLTTYLVKALYAVSKKLTVSAGYVHEKFDYEDAQLDGYRHVIGDPVNTYLTGAYKDQSYEADLVFVSMAYSF